MGGGPWRNAVYSNAKFKPHMRTLKNRIPLNRNYAGCFKFDSSSDFKHNRGKGFTPGLCMRRCKAFRYIALSKSFCKCDNFYDQSSKVADNQCNFKFVGAGGPGRNAVYHNKDFDVHAAKRRKEHKKAKKRKLKHKKEKQELKEDPASMDLLKTNKKRFNKHGQDHKKPQDDRSDLLKSKQQHHK